MIKMEDHRLVLGAAVPFHRTCCENMESGECETAITGQQGGISVVIAAGRCCYQVNGSRTGLHWPSAFQERVSRRANAHGRTARVEMMLRCGSATRGARRAPSSRAQHLLCRRSTTGKRFSQGQMHGNFNATLSHFTVPWRLARISNATFFTRSRGRT